MYENPKYIRQVEKVKRKYIQYENCDVIMGHFPYQMHYYLKVKHGWKMITWLRDPLEQLISHYSWIHNKPNIKSTPVMKKIRKMSIANFSKYSSNFYTRMIGSNPSIFDFIGIVEEFDKSIETFNNQFDCDLQPIDKIRRNINIWKKIEVSEEVREKLKQNHLRDYEFYEKVIKRYR